MVRIHPDPPPRCGAVAQLGEHLLCKQGVVGSIPISSTTVVTAGYGVSCTSGCAPAGVCEANPERRRHPVPRGRRGEKNPSYACCIPVMGRLGHFVDGQS